MRGEGAGEVLGPALIFCLSFTAMFVALGMSATGLGESLHDTGSPSPDRRLADRRDGRVLHRTLFVPRFNRECRPEKLLARRHGRPGDRRARLRGRMDALHRPDPRRDPHRRGDSDTVGNGGLLLAFYSLGLAVPFLLSAVAFDRVRPLFSWFRNHYVVITIVSGAILIAMGVLPSQRRAHPPEHLAHTRFEPRAELDLRLRRPRPTSRRAPTPSRSSARAIAAGGDGQREPELLRASGSAPTTWQSR